MKIFPAIDIKGGKCVRLLKGDFGKLTQYKKSPFDQANIFSNLGFKNLHLIDLDGALEGKSINKEIIQIHELSNNSQERMLKSLIEAHFLHTESAKAKEILSDWTQWKAKFKMLVPPSEKEKFGIKSIEEVAT